MTAGNVMARQGHYIGCDDCGRSWLIDDLPETCRWSECTFPEVARQVRDDLEKLRKMRDGEIPGSGLPIE